MSGGIAAYKAPDLVRQLVKGGMEVQVLLTEAATHFVTEMSLATVSRRPVRRRILDTVEEGRVGHIELADWPDVVVVAPATADVMARAAAGMADDLVTTCLLATRAPVLWAPAMNTNMWRHPATRHNLQVLASRGARFVGPDAGDLACGWIGEGRMIDPPMIVEAVRGLVDEVGGGDSWAGRRVLVSAGPTRAYLDPVRYLTNASTGAMGFALAEVAAAAGADVTLVAGPVERPTPPGVRRVDVETADEMLDAMDRVLGEDPVDLVAMVAAVADLAPADASARHHKLDKDDLERSLREGALVRGVDVLKTLVARHPDVFFLGFGAQTVDTDDADAVESTLISAGRRKLADKKCQAIFVNRVGAAGVGFASPTNAGVLLLRRPDGTVEDVASGAPVAKLELARWILERIRPHLGRASEPT